MLCWFRKKKLFEYAIGKLNFVQTQNIEDHLKGCVKCRDYVKGVQKIINMNVGEEQPFLSEVFWRKFDERLDLNLSLEPTPTNPAVRHFRFISKPLPKFAFSVSLAICILLVFSYFSTSNPFKSMLANFQNEQLIETVLMIEDNTELHLNGDEDAYIEEMLLQIALQEA